MNERTGNQILNTCMLPIIPPGSSARSAEQNSSYPLLLILVMGAQPLLGDTAALLPPPPGAVGREGASGRARPSQQPETKNQCECFSPNHLDLELTLTF